jgi:hypothetical protein
VACHSLDVHGPALTINTACSASLVAVDHAMRDARTGRLDFALAGGVNLVASSPKVHAHAPAPPFTSAIQLRPAPPSPQQPHSFSPRTLTRSAFRVSAPRLRSQAADSFAALRRATMLSPTARCHTFSAAADGYVRSEGGVIFLLQSSASAEQLGADAPPARAGTWPVTEVTTVTRRVVLCSYPEVRPLFEPRSLLF